MIDKKARTELGELIRHLISGCITNDEFEDRTPYNNQDMVLSEAEHAAWYLYSDIYEYKLTGKHKVSKDTRKIFARIILFLHSELEYKWPTYPYDSLLSYFGWIPCIKSKLEHRGKLWKMSGDVEVWPFIRYEDFEKANKCPKLLSGYKEWKSL